MPDDPQRLWFTLFNEIGILEQLSRAILEAHLPKGLIRPHFTVLNHLIRVADGRTPLELARAFQVPKPSMTHTLAGLERHGFVELRPNPDDGRSKQVWITPAGRAFRDRAIAAIGPDFDRLSDTLDPDRYAELLPALTRLREVLDRMRDTDR